MVLETLSPAERLAFVLHDMFAVPFEEIAPMIERSPAAARQLASRARRRVQGQAPAPDPDLARQREVVDAFFAAARDGDFDALVAVLDPDVVLRADGGAARAAPDRRDPRSRRGGRSGACSPRRLAPFVRPALINGAAGVVVVAGERVQSIMAFTVVDGRIAAIEVLLDPGTSRRRRPECSGRLIPRPQNAVRVRRAQITMPTWIRPTTTSQRPET